MTDSIRSYRDLSIWQDSISLAAALYTATRAFPKEELYGMTAQIRRAAASVPANIAEGHGREQTGAFVQFLRIAQGSLKELETHLHLASCVGLTSEETTSEFLVRTESLGKRIRSLIRSLQDKLDRDS